MLCSSRLTPPTSRPSFAPFDASRGGGWSESPAPSPKAQALGDGSGAFSLADQSQAKGPRKGTTAGPGKEGADATSLGISSKDFVRQNPAPEGAEKPARRQLSRYRLQRYAAELAPNHGGLRSCFWNVMIGASGVSLKGQPLPAGGYDKVKLGGLVVCGSHLCPVCGPRVAAARQDEVEAVIAWALRSGLFPVFLTLTTRHGAGDRLADLAGAQRDALRRWKRHRSYADRKDQICGVVSAFETTHAAKNGWHPHIHLLLLVQERSMGSAVRLIAGLRDAWTTSAEAAGLTVGRSGFQAVGVKAGADNAKKIAGYFTKWNAAAEIARADKKKAREKGRTPSQLLGDAYTGDARAATLWAEYAEAMKGKSVLRFSPGLKEAAGLLDVPDEEAAAPAPDDKARLIELICGGHWAEAKANGLDRNDLLRVAKSGRAAVLEYLADLREAAASGVPWHPLE